MPENKDVWVFEKTKEKIKTFAGGNPFLSKSEYLLRQPINNNLAFLVQIDLKDIPEKFKKELPKTGIMQVFYTKNKLFGMDWENKNENFKDFKVRVLSEWVEPNSEFSYNFKKGVEKDLNRTPLLNPHKRVYYSGSEYRLMPEELLMFREDFETEVENDELANTSIFKAEFYMGGEPYFVQDDFRYWGQYKAEFILGSFSGDNILWGDGGIGSVWRNEKENPNDFTKSFLYWDCY